MSDLLWVDGSRRHSLEVCAIGSFQKELDYSTPRKESKMLIPKNKNLRDRKYLDCLRQQDCFVTGMRTHDHETVDPAHTGTGGTGYKGPDNECLPLAHSLHLKSHNKGVVSFWCDAFKQQPHILYELLSSYGKNHYYQKYLDEINESH